jgi:hypothetical protein
MALSQFTFNKNNNNNNNGMVEIVLSWKPTLLMAYSSKHLNLPHYEAHCVLKHLLSLFA